MFAKNQKMFTHISGYFFGYAAKIWWQFIAAGLFALGSPLFIGLEVSISRVILVGVVALLIGITLKLNYHGLQIKRNKIRDFTAIFGIKTGPWQNLPRFQRIAFTMNNVSFWNTPNGVSPTFKSNVTTYTIALFSEEENPDYFIQTENKQLANKQVDALSKLLKLPVEKA